MISLFIYFFNPYIGKLKFNLSKLAVLIFMYSDQKQKSLAIVGAN